LSFSRLLLHSIFFYHATPPTEIYTLSLHDALPILTEPCTKDFFVPQKTVVMVSSREKPKYSALNLLKNMIKKNNKITQAESAISGCIPISSRKPGSNDLLKLLLEKKNNNKNITSTD